jgi:hypothetical protein
MPKRMLEELLEGMTTCLQKLQELHVLCTFQTIEGARHGPASNSELRRWFQQKCVEVNFESVAFNDPWPEFVKSLVLFPKNKKKRCTLFWDPSVTLIQVSETI